jgi:hypothetical protein
LIHFHFLFYSYDDFTQKKNLKNNKDINFKLINHGMSGCFKKQIFFKFFWKHNNINQQQKAIACFGWIFSSASFSPKISAYGVRQKKKSIITIKII